jgi:hypothetical protein
MKMNPDSALLTPIVDDDGDFMGVFVPRGAMTGRSLTITGTWIEWESSTFKKGNGVVIEIKDVSVPEES